MDPDDFFYFGRILKSFGNKGHLMITLDVDDPGKYKELELVYVGIDQNRVPFFIEAIEFRSGNRAIIKIEDVNSASDGEPFKGRELYLPASMLPELRGRKFYYHEVAGFDVIDEVHGLIGKIDTILEFPQQPLIRILKGNKEILIPLVDEVILKVDRRQKVMRIRAPEGLLEIYL